MSTSTTTTATQTPAVLKLRSDAPGPVFPEGSALADLSRGPNPLTGMERQLERWVDGKEPLVKTSQIGTCFWSYLGPSE